MSVQIHLQEGIQLLKNGEHDKALIKFEAVLVIDPDHVSGLMYRGVLYRKKERFQEALQDMNRAIGLEEKHADLFSERAVTHFYLNDNHAALNDMNEAQQLEPENPYRYSSRAYIRERLGDVNGAIEDYKIAIKLDPDDAIAHNNLGLLEEKLGRIQKAKAYFKEADRLDRLENPHLYENQGNQGSQTPKEASTNPPASATNLKQTTSTSEPEKNPAPSNSVGDHIKVMRKVLTSKEEFQEFLKFMGNLFSGNKNA